MQPHEKVAKLLPRVEPVEQLYDGLNGKVIKWTLENGNKSHDPSCLAFLVGRDGKVVSKCPSPYSASSFTKWLGEEVVKYEKSHPRTRVPFVPPTMEDGRCVEFDEAQQERKPILLYVGRETAGDKKAKKQIKVCRKFEKGTLSSKKAAAEAKGWVLLRFDIADKRHAEFLKQFGVKTAPALLMFAPGAEKPTDLGTKVKGPNLAYHLKKAK